MNDISTGEADRARKYLVTGASGFIGRALCSRLLASEATVIGTSRRNVVFEHANWAHTCIDLTDAGQVDELFAEAKPDYVIHLASCVTGKREIEWVRATFDGNLRSSVNVLVAAPFCCAESRTGGLARGAGRGTGTSRGSFTLCGIEVVRERLHPNDARAL